jgi:hypothetical protein
MPMLDRAARGAGHGGVPWRSCSTCGSLEPLPPDVDVCDTCEPEHFATIAARAGLPGTPGEAAGRSR